MWNPLAFIQLFALLSIALVPKRKSDPVPWTAESFFCSSWLFHWLEPSSDGFHVVGGCSRPIKMKCDSDSGNNQCQWESMSEGNEENEIRRGNVNAIKHNILKNIVKSVLPLSIYGVMDDVVIMIKPTPGSQKVGLTHKHTKILLTDVFYRFLVTL